MNFPVVSMEDKSPGSSSRTSAGKFRISDEAEAEDEAETSEIGGSARGERPQDGHLPIANISRIMRKAVPETVKISKDSKDLIQTCVSEFISFITSEASLKCQTERRKTITGDDLLWAIEALGFQDYVNPLKLYLDRYRKQVINLC
ncbi:Nuclear transcription factor Y subunit B-1 [Zostera marina]|uniref:Nuclear transcription factor Y subunit B-1 n=1 Tax=Zostera marina TaxID=29655 RepID=A0A0K9NTY5_ZOSMR|nr:Nuclear transcription factor Y subunit B-1 [Zostera marina]